jgi:hypothetical protein
VLKRCGVAYLRLKPRPIALCAVHLTAGSSAIGVDPPPAQLRRSRQRHIRPARRTGDGDARTRPPRAGHGDPGRQLLVPRS